MQHLKAGEFSITLHRNRYLIAFLLILLLSSIYVFVFGESGLLERYMLEGKKNQLLQKNEALKKINRGLRKKLQAHADGRVEEADFANAGIVQKGGKVLILKGIEKENSDMAAVPERTTGAFPLEHIRIIWIVVSLLILLLYFSRIYRSPESEKDVF